MAGKQKWGTRQDRLTGQAWCTLVFKGLATVNPGVVFNPFRGVQPPPAAWEHSGMWEGQGWCVQWGVPAHLPTSSAPQLHLGKDNESN